MPSDAVNKATRQEWRDLGFFYDRDDEALVWRLIGSRHGLLRFKEALVAYASDPRRASDSEHDHYGPYMYLKVMTWPKAGFDDHAIRGPLPELARLAALIEGKLSGASPGSKIQIKDEFSPDSTYSLVLDVREEGFDPASADPLLQPDEAR